MLFNTRIKVKGPTMTLLLYSMSSCPSRRSSVCYHWTSIFTSETCPDIHLLQQHVGTGHL